jgi:hypothetical protein
MDVVNFIGVAQEKIRKVKKKQCQGRQKVIKLFGRNGKILYKDGFQVNIKRGNEEQKKRYTKIVCQGVIMGQAKDIDPRNKKVGAIYQHKKGQEELILFGSRFILV